MFFSLFAAAVEQRSSGAQTVEPEVQLDQKQPASKNTTGTRTAEPEVQLNQDQPGRRDTTGEGHGSHHPTADIVEKREWFDLLLNSLFTGLAFI